MKKEKNVGVRMSDELAERIDKYAERLSNQADGAKISRSNAARILIEKGLATVEKGESKEK
ncbi:hypothetical protein [Shewanella algae]|uniref:hypothetical protein n=1 Tax=Shewanella algae TaxID=38313 RepID=UPI0031F58A28